MSVGAASNGRGECAYDLSMQPLALCALRMLFSTMLSLCVCYRSLSLPRRLVLSSRSRRAAMQYPVSLVSRHRPGPRPLSVAAASQNSKSGHEPAETRRMTTGSLARLARDGTTHPVRYTRRTTNITADRLHMHSNCFMIPCLPCVRKPGCLASVHAWPLWVEVPLVSTLLSPCLFSISLSLVLLLAYLTAARSAIPPVVEVVSLAK